MDNTTFGPLQVPKAALLVANDLRGRIVRGELLEGQALPNETELMSHFQVSRPTLREALRILESEGLVAVRRGARGGARVTLPDAAVTARHAAIVLQLQGTTVEDVFDARAIMEPAAVRLIAERRPKGAIERLRECHEAAHKAMGDPLAYPLATTRFHEQVVELSGNRTLTLLARVTMEIMAAHHKATLDTLNHSQRVLQTADWHHAQLLDLLEAGDADAAAELWQRHLREAARLALNALGRRRRVELLHLTS
jgi:DNA-binding FadR family transcriptional regulator